MYSKTFSVSTNLHESKIIEIEANIYRGMFAFSIIGASYSYTKEIREKIVCILKLMDLRLPNKRIVINFPNIDYTVKSSHFDLAILILVLKLLGVIKESINDVFVGELSLDGSLLPLEYPYLFMSAKLSNKLIIPYDNNIKAVNSKDKSILMAKNVFEIIDYCNIINNLHYLPIHSKCLTSYKPSINDVIGQEQLIRALIIAISGRHHILISGVAGSGKSYTIKAIKSIIPESDEEDLMDINLFKSTYDEFSSQAEFLELSPLIRNNILFGDSRNIPIIKKANKGFIVMDEINTFAKNLLDNLRIPMESQEIKNPLNNDKEIMSYFTIIASMNPCPCGNKGSKISKCTCSMAEIARYSNKINKPLIERFHIKIKTDLSYNIQAKRNNYNIIKLRNDIKRVWDIQKNRYKNCSWSYNGHLDKVGLLQFVKLNSNLEKTLDQLCEFYCLSIREKHNIMKVARTIADLENEDNISEKHLYEAVAYQEFD